MCLQDGIRFGTKYTLTFYIFFIKIRPVLLPLLSQFVSVLFEKFLRKEHIWLLRG